MNDLKNTTPELREIEVISLAPGDVVVLTIPKDVYSEHTGNFLAELFPKNRVLILFEGMKITKITNEEYLKTLEG